MIQADLIRSDLARVQAAFRLPGLAVAIVENGDVTFLEGMGYQNFEEHLPFTPDTLCLIASATKSFTAGLAGILVDEQIAEWTRPVRAYWPDLRMMDEFAAKEMTLEDMLCHRCGLPWHENLLVHGVGRELPDSGRQYRQELLRRLAYFDPAHPFRTRFDYQDIVFTCGGAILEHVTDTDYEVLVQSRLLDVLGMVQSTFSRRQAEASGHLAQGYGVVDGEVKPIPFCDTRYISPSAGLYSSVAEMSQWLALQLGRGRFGGRQIISEESMAWIHAPHMVAPNPSLFAGGPVTYGQGWYQTTLHGSLMLTHGGSFNGYRSFMAFLPNRHAGVVVLTNLNLTEGASAAGFACLDRLCGVDGVENRIQVALDRTQGFRDAEARAGHDFQAGRNLQNRPQYPLGHYQGTFHHPGYGTFIVELRDDTLWQTYDGRSYPMQPYNGDSFATHYQSTENRLLDMVLTFECDGQRDVVCLRVPFIPGIEVPRFEKTGDA